MLCCFYGFFLFICNKFHSVCYTLRLCAALRKFDSLPFLSEHERRVYSVSLAICVFPCSLCAADALSFASAPYCMHTIRKMQLCLMPDCAHVPAGCGIAWRSPRRGAHTRTIPSTSIQNRVPQTEKDPNAEFIIFQFGKSSSGSTLAAADSSAEIRSGQVLREIAPSQIRNDLIRAKSQHMFVAQRLSCRDSCHGKVAGVGVCVCERAARRAIVSVYAHNVCSRQAQHKWRNDMLFASAPGRTHTHIYTRIEWPRKNVRES